LTHERVDSRRRMATALLVSSLALATPAGDSGPDEIAPPRLGRTSGLAAPRPLVATWIPARPEGAPTGSVFGRRTRGWSGQRRQEAALRELRAGNVPPFLRRFVPVLLTHEMPDGRIVEATVWVSADYASIGTDADYLRMPLDRPGAVTLARSFHCVLPTRKIVDAINDQADVHLSPRPLPPGPMMRSSEYYLRHNAMIQEQLGDRAPGLLVSGHKKDVVVTNRLRGRQRVAIYGWHRRDGEPIQPLSTVHGARYADYSHGIRFVYDVVAIDGELRSIYDVLADPELGPVLSYEGQITASVLRP